MKIQKKCNIYRAQSQKTSGVDGILLPRDISHKHPITILILVCKHILGSMQNIPQLALTQCFLPWSSMGPTLT